MKTIVRSRPRAFSLVGVLVAAAILAIVSMTFMRVMNSAGRAQGNLAKKGEADTLSMAIRTVLANNNACVASAQSFNLNDPTPQNFIMRDAAGQEMFRTGTVTNGVKVESLTAQAAPPVRGVQFVTVNATFKKMGAQTVGAPSWSHTYYFNAVVNAAGTPLRCFTGNESDGTFSVVGQQSVLLTATPSGCATLNVGCPSSVFVPSDYSPKDVAPTSCDYMGDGCPKQEQSPGTAVVAKGNWMMVSFRTDATLGIGTVAGCPLSTGVFAITIGGWVKDSGGSFVHKVNIGMIQRNGSNLNTIDRLIGLSSAPELVAVNAGQTYYFGTRIFMADSSPSTGVSCTSTATITHYLENNGP